MQSIHISCSPLELLTCWDTFTSKRSYINYSVQNGPDVQKSPHGDAGTSEQVCASIKVCITTCFLPLVSPTCDAINCETVKMSIVQSSSRRIFSKTPIELIHFSAFPGRFIRKAQRTSTDNYNSVVITNKLVDPDYRWQDDKWYHPSECSWSPLCS